MMRKQIAGSLVIIVLWTTVVMAAPEVPQRNATGSLSSDEMLQRIDEFASAIDELRSAVDRSRFDLEALLDRLDYDDEQIIDFVRREIRFEPYLGLLRGAQGTLMSGGGNALDQAVLLATLLKDAGFEARIRQGRLSARGARELLAGTGKQLSASRERYDLEAVSDRLQVAISNLTKGLDLGDAPTRVLELPDVNKKKGLVEAEAKHVLEALGQRRPREQSLESVRERLLDEAKDYYWVEYRASPRGWTSEHVAFGKLHPAVNEELSSLAPERVFTDSIPGELHHQIVFNVVIEQKRGDTLVEKEVLSWTKPAANLHARAFFYSNYPNTLERIGDSSLPEVLEEASFLLPVFSGGSDAPLDPFDFKGNQVPLDAISSPGAGLFMTVSEGLDRATSSLRNLGKRPEDREDESIALTGLRISYGLRSPAGEKTFSRSIVDRIPAPNRQEGNLRVLLENPLREKVEIFSFMPVVGGIPDEYVIWQLLDFVEASFQQLRYIFQRQLEGQAVERAKLAEGVRDWGLELLYKWSLFDQFESESVNYRPEPGILVLEKSVLPTGGLRVVTDIVTSSRRSLAVDGEVVLSRFDDSVRQGVWETLIEAEPLPWDPLAKQAEFSAFRQLAESTRTADDLVVITPEDRSSLPKVEIDARSRDAIESELDQGFWVALPKRQPDPAREMESVAWWRIDAETGTVVGVAGGNRGISVTEYLIKVTGIAVVVTMVLAPICGLATYMITESACSAGFWCAGTFWDVGVVTGTVSLENPEGMSKGLGFAIALAFVAVSAAIGGIGVAVC